VWARGAVARETGEGRAEGRGDEGASGGRGRVSMGEGRGRMVSGVRLAPTRDPKGFCTLNIEDRMVLYALQQRPLNGPLNLENAAGFSIYRVSLNDPLSI
jgi:hypothetical protein